MQVWDTSEWRVRVPRVRLQTNGCDCGVFTILFANRVALNRGFDFRQVRSAGLGVLRFWGAGLGLPQG